MTTFFLYIAGFDGRVEQVGVARSTNQQDWEITPQPAVPAGAPGTWDAAQTSNPSVLLEDGRFRMWYQGVDEDGRYRIGYAESEDGWTWHKHPGLLFERPGLAEMKPVPRREGYHQPLVLRVGSGYRMYFNDHRNGLGHIRMAESPDGLTWEVVPGDLLAPEKDWERRGLHYPWVIQDGAGYVMWYTSENHKNHWYLSRAVSEDGRVWRREPDTRPVIGFETVRRASRMNWLPRHLTKLYPNYRHPNIRAIKGGVAPTNPLSKAALRFYDSVVFPFRSWRYISFNNGSVVKGADGRYLMYFQSRDENGVLAVGRAESGDGIHWQATGTNILREAVQREKIAWVSVFDADPHLLIVE